jgi:hypothetical protein
MCSCFWLFQAAGRHDGKSYLRRYLIVFGYNRLVFGGNRCTRKEEFTCGQHDEAHIEDGQLQIGSICQGKLCQIQQECSAW